MIIRKFISAILLLGVCSAGITHAVSAAEYVCLMAVTNPYEATVPLIHLSLSGIELGDTATIEKLVDKKLELIFAGVMIKNNSSDFSDKRYYLYSGDSDLFVEKSMLALHKDTLELAAGSIVWVTPEGRKHFQCSPTR